MRGAERRSAQTALTIVRQECFSAQPMVAGGAAAIQSMPITRAIRSIVPPLAVTDTARTDVAVNPPYASDRTLYSLSVRLFTEWLAARGRPATLDELTRSAIREFTAGLARLQGDSSRAGSGCSERRGDRYDAPVEFVPDHQRL
ncbi:MAG: hypothetical protein LC775_00645, partial [Acidobacteria bacterium]|nr:hypothetical protein [Acidobacteriota bacterium]